MSKTPANPEIESNSEAGAKTHFAKAMEEAKAAAQALGKEAIEKASEVREKLYHAGDDLAGQARARGSDAMGKAAELANQGKTKASQAISGLGKLVEEQGATVDDIVGNKYGDYVRSAGKSIQQAAAKLEEKSFEEIGKDAGEFVRKSPALAVGMAAAAGFLLARLIRRK